MAISATLTIGSTVFLLASLEKCATTVAIHTSTTLHPLLSQRSTTPPSQRVKFQTKVAHKVVMPALFTKSTGISGSSG